MEKKNTLSDIYESELIQTIELNQRNIDIIFKNKIKENYYFIVTSKVVKFYCLHIPEKEHQDKKERCEIGCLKCKIQNINRISYLMLRNMYLKKNLHKIFPYFENSNEINMMKTNIFKYIGVDINNIKINEKYY
tara:strand:+ start:3343 stop:3744 length:402 start_codon:yes stop_codon:yes gene_type:complete